MSNKGSRIDTTSSQATVSKYFSRNSDADESSDFQERKFTFKKAEVQKPKPKGKPKQCRKRGKGQKDIRSALKGEKSNLLSYTEDFKKVCRQSGIDVDSEQLQIAIAITKSLKDVKENSDEVSQATSSVERCNRIKKTLLEYGFKVPDNKKTLVTKRPRGIKKHSKLLHTSDEVRQQLIIDKYSQLLFSFNIPASDITNITEITDSHSNYLYSLSTQQPYTFLRDNSIFYVEGLFQECTAELGNLLKDWCKIPGRTSSPKQKKPVSKPFSTMSIEQEKLDVILSGKMQFSNEIFSNIELSNKENGSIAKLNPNISSGNASEREESKIDNNYQITYEPTRSQSPDLFDDSSNEEIVLDEKSETNKVIQTVSNHEVQNFDTINHEGKDIAVSTIKTNTISINHESIQILQDNDQEPINDLTQSSDSDDCSLPYVDVGKYNCDSKVDYSVNVEYNKKENNSSSSKSNFNEFIYDHSDLSSVENNSTCISNHIDLADMYHKGEKCQLEIDLTQSSPDEDKVCIEKVINLKRLSAELINNDVDNDIKSDSVNKNEKRNVVNLNNSSHNFDSVSEDLISSQSHKVYENSSGISKKVNLPDLDQKAECQLEIDLTQSSPDEDKVCINDSTIINEEIAYTIIGAEYIDYDYVDNYEKVNKYESISNSPHKPISFSTAPEDLVSSQSNIAFEYSIGISNSVKADLEQKGEKSQFEIDLTQLSYDKNKVCIKNSTIKDCINGEKAYNRISTESIDYDNYRTQNLSNSPHKSTSFHSTLEDIVSSQSSNIAFEISDEELDYSMNKSKYCKENSFECDKPIENIYNSQPQYNFSRISHFKPNNTFNRSFSDSSLPAVEIKGTKFKAKTPVKYSKSQSTTPVKKVIEDNSIQTPKDSEYIIKTQNVTPMPNYDNLGTPQINKELDKYGLKPFKRKRAIQLLKHLYNQTHPIIEKTIEDVPNKRFKPSTSEDIDLETVLPDCDNIYVCTTEKPVLKEVVCDPDEWVFQKKEKSKISSCRVPLHISFHNYVSCRRYLREAILRYEPVSIDVIHKDLVGYGFRYDPKDLLKFMDKKCITVKTADNNKKRTKY